MTCRTGAALAAAVLAVTIPAGAVRAQALTPIEQRIVAHVNTQAANAVALLERTVNMNSGTFNLAGVRRVGDELTLALQRRVDLGLGDGQLVEHVLQRPG